MRTRHFAAWPKAALLVAVLGVSALVAAGRPTARRADNRVTATTETNAKQLVFHDAMRKLWEEHVLWTRLFIVSDVFNSPDLAATTTRLLANQTDIGNAFAPFYGSAQGDHLTALLKTHILLAAQILADAKAGNTNGVNQSENAWYENANEIAAFLHQLNPRNWSFDELADMMQTHLKLTLAEAVDELTGNYTQSVAEFDAVENEILGMADTLSSGIIAQFPTAFGGPEH